MAVQWNGADDIALADLQALSAPVLDPNNNTDTPPPTLVPALQQQLGLKLGKKVGPMPVIVIDAAERPTPN